MGSERNNCWRDVSSAVSFGLRAERHTESGRTSSPSGSVRQRFSLPRMLRGPRRATSPAPATARAGTAVKRPARPYKSTIQMDLLWKTLRALQRPGRVRTVDVPRGVLLRGRRRGGCGRARGQRVRTCPYMLGSALLYVGPGGDATGTPCGSDGGPAGEAGRSGREPGSEGTRKPQSPFV